MLQFNLTVPYQCTIIEVVFSGISFNFRVVLNKTSDEDTSRVNFLI